MREGEKARTVERNYFFRVSSVEVPYWLIEYTKKSFDAVDLSNRRVSFSVD
jgi:hypothetical protein